MASMTMISPELLQELSSPNLSRLDPEMLAALEAGSWITRRVDADGRTFFVVTKPFTILDDGTVLAL